MNVNGNFSPAPATTAAAWTAPAAPVTTEPLTTAPDVRLTVVPGERSVALQGRARTGLRRVLGIVRSVRLVRWPDTHDRSASPLDHAARTSREFDFGMAEHWPAAWFGPPPTVRRR